MYNKFDLRNKEQFPVLHGIEDYLLRFGFLRITNQHIGIINNFMKGKEFGKDRDINSEFYSRDLLQLISKYKRESVNMASDCYNYFDELKDERDEYFGINIQSDEQRFFFIKQYNLRVIKEIDKIVSTTEENIRCMYYIFINEPGKYPVDLKVCFGNWYTEFDKTNEQDKKENNGLESEQSNSNLDFVEKHLKALEAAFDNQAEYFKALQTVANYFSDNPLNKITPIFVKSGNIKNLAFALGEIW